jgi:seryl-tRNA synthetase
MGIQKELRRKIEKKHGEIQGWSHEKQRLLDQTRELTAKIREANAYILGLEETLKLLPRDLTDAATDLRPGTALARAREEILKAGKPIHITELLKNLGKEVDHNSRAALSGSLAVYVRKNEIFTRPAPNTFGLVEMDQGQIAEGQPPPGFGSTNGQETESGF